jgi:FkbM family methyltransferase
MTMSAPFSTYALPAWQQALVTITRSLPENWLGRRLALWLRKPVLLSVQQRPVDTALMGFRMRLYVHDNVSEKRVLFTPQFFDAEELTLLKARATAGFKLIDIGANAGIYSLFTAACCQDKAHIIAVEPQLVMLARLRDNITLNKFESITVKPVALSDRAGEITFHLSTDNRGQASLLGCGEALTVPTQTLLSLMDEVGMDQADALKIDIEGAEALVLGTFFATAAKARWPRLVFIERNNSKWGDDIVARMKSLGYTEHSGGRMNVILELA